MTTLAIMKATIVREIRRTNIDTDIAAAINVAIAAYDDERFFFSESLDVTFPTVSSQEFYTSSDEPLLPNLEKIDYVKLIVSNTVFDLEPLTPTEIEEASTSGTSTGQPGEYCFYQQQLRFYPVPDAVYTIRLGGVFTPAAPASDSEASNPWMTTAERLIRSRAKMELALHVLRNPQLAQDMNAATNEAFDQLKRRTNRKTGTGRIAAMPF